MSYWLEAVVNGIRRKLCKLQGSVKPLSAQDTTVPKWMTAPPYDPLNGEVILGMDGPERIQLAADGKLYPPLVSGGLIPGQVIGPGVENFVVTTNDTLLPLITQTGNAGIKLLSAYQSSGGALQLQICDASGTQLHLQSIPNAVVTSIVQQGPYLSVSVKWAGAAGATQLLMYQPQRLIPMR